MTLPLAEICDPDCVVSLSPAVIDWPDTEVYARGPQAIMRRVFYAWVEIGILDLEGESMEDAEIAKLRRDLDALAEAEDYVLAANTTITVDDGDVAIGCRMQLVDGQTYQFNVSTADAVSVDFGG